MADVVSPQDQEPAERHPAAERAYATGLASVVGGLLVVPLLLGPWAWYLGAGVLRDVEREPGRWAGAGRARAGLVLGAVATTALGLTVLALVGWAAVELVALRRDTGY
ncbi:MAG: hypothetical protein NTV28_10950 [Propionibacteriales bacterium]|nr:hypothetical protein [Propionibacteriales bacterium]